MRYTEQYLLLMAVVQKELELQEALELLRQPLPAATCLPLLYACV
jgi:hypothetical protein